MVSFLRMLCVAVLGFLVVSCAGTGANRLSERAVSRADLINTEEAADTDCSYFYFLWGRTSEIDGRFDEALEAYEKAVVCDGDADYVIRHLASLLLRMNRKKQAIAWVDKLVLSNPADPRIKIFQADLYNSMGEVDKAALLYKSVLRDDKENTAALTKLGRLYLNNMDYTNARAVFEKLVEYDPASFPGYYYLARLYQELKFYDKAIASYRKALDLNWSLPLAMEVAGFYETQEFFEKAIALYNKILAEDDSNDKAGARLVRLYLALDQTDKALDVLHTLRETTLDAHKVDFTIGRILMEQQRYDEAIELFMRMLDREPEVDGARSLLALAYYEKGQKSKAKDFLLQIPPESKSYDEALFMLIKIYSEEKNYDAAIDLIKNILTDVEPVQINYYFVLASLYEEAGKMVDAENIFVETINQFPESTEAYFKFGMFLERSGRPDEAMSQMEEVLSLNPQDAYALNYIGYTWAERNEHLDRALDFIKQAVSIRPEDGFIRDSLGWVYFRLGKLDRALDELKKAAAIEPEDPTIQEHLGDVYLADGNKDQAVVYYLQSFELSDKEENKKRLQDKIDSMK